MKRQFIALVTAVTLVAATPATTVFASNTGADPLPEITDRLTADAHFGSGDNAEHMVTLEYPVDYDQTQKIIKDFNLTDHNIIAGYAFQDGNAYEDYARQKEYTVDFTDLNDKRLTDGHTYRVHHYNQDLTKEVETKDAVADKDSFSVTFQVPEGYSSYVLVEDLGDLSKVTMYRAYNPNSGEHFYTSSEKEFRNIVSLGWKDEGTGWIAPAKSDTPVYRLYNANGGEHHYTTSTKEKDALVKAGWKDEGIGWYSDDQKTVPLYREYNPNAFANNHNYTTSEKEKNYLISIGWKDEGIGWYGVSAE